MARRERLDGMCRALSTTHNFNFTKIYYLLTYFFVSLHVFNLENRNSSGSYFSMYGICLISFILLFAILVAIDDGTTKNKINTEVAHRYKRSMKSPQNQKCEFLKANIVKNVVVRHKRDLSSSIDPIEVYENNEEYARAKRRVASALKEYTNCRQKVADDQSCSDVHRKMLKLANEFSAKYSVMKDLMENFKSYMNIVDDRVGNGETKVSGETW